MGQPHIYPTSGVKFAVANVALYDDTKIGDLVREDTADAVAEWRRVDRDTRRAVWVYVDKEVTLHATSHTNQMDPILRLAPGSTLLPVATRASGGLITEAITTGGNPIFTQTNGIWVADKDYIGNNGASTMAIHLLPGWNQIEIVNRLCVADNLNTAKWWLVYYAWIGAGTIADDVADGVDGWSVSKADTYDGDGNKNTNIDADTPYAKGTRDTLNFRHLPWVVR